MNINHSTLVVRSEQQLCGSNFQFLFVFQKKSPNTSSQSVYYTLSYRVVWMTQWGRFENWNVRCDERRVKTNNVSIAQVNERSPSTAMNCHSLAFLVCFLLGASALCSAVVDDCEQQQHRPPFLYVTTHDEVPNVLKYSMTGCLLSSAVLLSSPSLPLPSFMELRTMAFGQHWDGESKHQNALFIADGVSEHSAVSIFSDCAASSPSSSSSSLSSSSLGHRLYLGKVVSSKEHRGVDHSYGLAFDANEHLFATFQHTDVLLRFVRNDSSNIPGQRTTYQPGDIPPVLQQPTLPLQQTSNNNNSSSSSSSSRKDVNIDHQFSSRRVSGDIDFFPGTFLQFGKPNEHHRRDAQGIRSTLVLHYCRDGFVFANNHQRHPKIAQFHYENMSQLAAAVIERSLVWTANEDMDAVLLADLSTGLVLQSLPIHNPISMFFDGHSQQVFISSKRKHRRGAVVAVNARTLREVQSYSTNVMDHPTGLTVYRDTLYVGLQERAEIVKFRVSTGKYLGVVVNRVMGDIEHLLLTPC
jgi:hypothetical protein